MSYQPFNNLTIEFADTHVEADSITDTFTSSEISLMMLGVNETLRGVTESRKVLCVGDVSLFVPLIVWRLLGSPSNPLHEIFLHNMWSESGLSTIKQLVSTRMYPFTIRNGYVENTLQSYFPGQVAYVFYSRALGADPEQEYDTVFREVTLVKSSLYPDNFVFMCKPATEAERRAVEDVFMGYRVKRFDQAPNMLYVFPP